MIKTIEFNNKEYPHFQCEGNASQFAIPFAKHICLGEGLDIGCMKREWAFPGATPIDLSFDDEYHATNLPGVEYDYIYSSHCLEHVVDWVGILDYWITKVKKGGSIFLYLPDYSQEYWRPWNNRKHVNILTPEYLKDYFDHKGCDKVFVSGVDLNNAFMVIVEK
jgi:hypothetical protein